MCVYFRCLPDYLLLVMNDMEKTLIYNLHGDVINTQGKEKEKCQDRGPDQHLGFNAAVF